MTSQKGAQLSATREWRTTFDAVNDAIWILDSDFNIVQCNASTIRLLDVDDGQICGRKCWEVIHGTDEPHPHCPVARMYKSGKRETSEVEIGERWFAISVDPLFTAGKISGAIHILRDITRQKRAEEEIRVTNAELMSINRIVSVCTSASGFRAMLDRILSEVLSLVKLEGGTICLVEPDETLSLAVHSQVSDPVMADMSSRKIRVGECLCGLCARNGTPLILRSQQEVRKYASRESLRQDPILFHAAYPLMTQGKCLGVLCVFTRAEVKPASHSLKLLETVTGQLAMVIHNARLHDETIRYAETLEAKVKDRTRQLEQANQELEAFGLSVSHDLRAPLRHITGYIEILQSKGDPMDDDARHCIKTIASSAVRMNELIEALLSLSRLGKDGIRLAWTDCNQLIKEAQVLVQSEYSGRTVDWQVQMLPQVMADTTLLRLVFVNLLSNALKFSRSRNPAVIRVSSRIDPDSERWIFEFQDNGVGFQQKKADKLFGVFQRLHPDFEGTGIGLAQVRRIVHRHGGRTWAEGNPDQGATFFFTLPKSAQSADIK